MNTAMLASFDELRAHLTARGAAPATATLGATAALLTAAAGSPFELAKTRVQDGLNSGVRDVFVEQVRARGARGLWRGFLLFALRTVPHACLVLLLMDQIKGQTKKP